MSQMIHIKSVTIIKTMVMFLICLFVIRYLYKQLQKGQDEKVALLAKHADEMEATLEKHSGEKEALLERFLVSRDTILSQYYQFVQQHDKTMSDLIQALRNKDS